MIEQLVSQFAGSPEAAQLLGPLQQAGLTPAQATSAVGATAEGAASAASSGGLASLLGGGGGLAGMAAGMLGGGGGLGGMLGGLAGGGAPAAATGGLPPQLVDTIAATVAQKTGLSPQMAKSAVTLVLPKIIDFVKSKMGG